MSFALDCGTESGADAIPAPMSTLPPQVRSLLKSVFGYDDFRPGQAEAIGAILDGGPVLAIMPTGSGKSMCYQLPALVQGGLTLVVSPLIALMRDQTQQMRALGVAAATLNSSATEEESTATWKAIRAGELRLLYVSPERLAMDGLVSALSKFDVRRIAIDEAHCVSQWGHDFRPEYRDIRRAVDNLGGVQTIAFTATADAATRADIVERLFARPPQVFLHSFDRPNIDLKFVAKDQPRRQISDFLSRRRGQSGIVYSASRKGTESLAAYLADQGHEAVPYHAGLELATRNRHQDRFLGEDGVVVVATVAFGMGVNKPDVRFVAHADMPASVEAYYQEIGRAGRDGLPADTLTLYGVEDMALRRRQVDEKDVSPERRQIEHARLGALLGLCEAVECRRQTLLRYFGEASEPCGRCDVCRGDVALYDGRIDAQKALSAVWRTGQRFGAGYLADLLTGAASEALRRNGHDALKTFGVGQDRSKRAWASVFRQLFAVGALDYASQEHGGFALTEKGEDILRGKQDIRLRAESERPRRRERASGGTEGPELAEAETALMLKLKALRRDLARGEGVAAFMVFPDRTLLEMVAKRPQTLDELGRVHGVGARKLGQYGESFIAALNDG
ncbi:MAG: ATP-dependent helicase RecQ [Hyphomicrobiales bacterium]|nr:ATP-dependent helicase RecQ [Hyphomicrobiales bacterium]